MLLTEWYIYAADQTV